MNNIITGPFQINTWIIPLADNKVIVVDPAACRFTGDEYKIIDYLSSRNLEPAGFVLTHGHFDHITGCAILKKKFPEVRLVCHEGDRFLTGVNAAGAQAECLEQMGLYDLVETLKNQPDADVYLNGGETLDSVLGGTLYSADVNKKLTEWKVLHTPGHSPGSICLYNADERKLVSGDTVFYHSYGRTDLDGGSQALMMRSLNMLVSELPADTLVYPGHDTFGFKLGENF